MTTSKIQVTEGAGKNVSSYSFTEDAVTKEVQRFTLNDSSGAESGTVGNPVQVELASTIAGERIADNLLAVETQMQTLLVSANTAVISQAGYVESLIFACNDSAPTAGQIDVYDSLAGSGTKIFHFEVTTTFFLPVTVPLKALLTNGLYIKFTTTADVNVSAQYRANA